MRRIAKFVVTAVAVLVLVACGGGTLGVESNDTGVHAVAEGSAEGSGSGDITIKEGYGLCINHIVNSGSFHVKATASDGKVVFDEDITNNIADFVDVEPGEYKLWISADNASGTVDVIPYDKEAQADADAKLDDALSQMGESAEELGLRSDSAESSDSSN